MKYDDVIQLQSEAQIALAILCTEKLLPMYEDQYMGDYRPHKAIAIAMQYVEADDVGTRAKLEIDAELAMLEANNARSRDCTGVANVAYHLARAIAYPKFGADSCALAVCYASRIVAQSVTIAEIFGQRSRYDVDFDELAKQAIQAVAE